jgi:hypothetical protein
MNLKMAVQKLVPYTSAPYAEHIFRKMGIEGNTKVTLEHIDILIEAAKKLRDLVKEMDPKDIKGYIIYTEESAED